MEPGAPIADQQAGAAETPFPALESVGFAGFGAFQTPFSSWKAPVLRFGRAPRRRLRLCACGEDCAPAAIPQARLLRLADLAPVGQIPPKSPPIAAKPAISPPRRRDRLPVAAVPTPSAAHPGKVLLKIAAIAGVGLAWGLFYLSIKAAVASSGLLPV